MLASLKKFFKRKTNENFPTLERQASLSPGPLEALALSEARNRALIEFAYDAFIGMDTKGQITDWNRQAEKTFGWKYEEVLGRSLSDVIIPHRFREAHKKGLERFLLTGAGPVLNKRIEVTALHRLRHEIPIELTIYPIPQGEGVLFGAFLHDTSEQKRNAQIQETQLKVTDALTKFSSLEEVIPELLKRICKGMNWSIGEFWLLDDKDGETLYCAGIWSDLTLLDSHFLDATQTSRFEWGIGLPGRVWQADRPLWIEDLSAEKDLPRFSQAMKAGIKSAMAFPLKTKEGLLGVMAFYISHQSVADTRLIELVANIGDYVGLFIQRKRVEEKLSQLYQELEIKIEERTRDLAAAYEQAKTANRLKDEFLATVSHELRTPLGVIVGYTDLILRTPMSEEEKTEALETIHRSGKVQVQIINDLLDVSRIITGKMQLEFGKVNFQTGIQAALETVRIAASAKNIRIVTHIDPNVGLGRGDTDRFQQILWNLLTNAIKFTPKEGWVEVSLKQVASRAQIEVIDSGKGIEAEFLPYVFERFRQEDASTTRKYGGLGLGLAIVRHLVEAHGGTVEAASGGANQGAKFTVRLPLLAFDDLNKSESSSTPAYPLPMNSVSLLLGVSLLAVEDDPDTRQMMGRILGNAGAKVFLASSALEAFKIFKEQQPDLLISDISMPGYSGYDLISMIRCLPEEQGGHVPAIAFTAHAHSNDKTQILGRGFDMQISKPVDGHELVLQIAQLLRKN